MIRGHLLYTVPEVQGERAGGVVDRPGRGNSTRRVDTEPWDNRSEQELPNVWPRRMTAKTCNKEAFKRRMQPLTVPTKATDAQKRMAQRLDEHFVRNNRRMMMLFFYRDYHREGMRPADSYRLDGTNRKRRSYSGTNKSNGGRRLLSKKEKPIFA